MDLIPAARKLYRLELSVTDIDGDAIPDAGPWEASFDAGETWKPGEEVVGHDEWWEWLVTGTAVTEPVPVDSTIAATITKTCTPIVRLIDNPEVLAEFVPTIYLVSPEA